MRLPQQLTDRAVALRQAGWTVPAIAAELGIARSTADQWTKHMPLPDTDARVLRRKEHSKRMTDAQWSAHRQRRDLEHRSVVDASRNDVGALSEREIALIGAAVYWCEGAKAKPWRPHDWRVIFTNSDLHLLRIFLRFVQLLGYEAKELTYRLSIHESADVSSAIRWWETQLELRSGAISAVTVKRHRPSNRRNVGADYHGCLVVNVPKAKKVYWKVEGIMQGLGAAVAVRADANAKLQTA